MLILQAIVCVCAPGLGRPNTNSRQTWYCSAFVTNLMTLRRSRRLSQWSKNSLVRREKANPGISNKLRMTSLNEPIPTKPYKDTKHCSL
jgi:hypothetical protein